MTSENVTPLGKVIGWLVGRQAENDTGVEIVGSTNLLESGLMDSVDFLHLVSFIEQEYGLKIPVDELTPDNFATPASVAELVERARRQASPATN